LMYLKFLSYLLFWGWILSVGYVRYLVPFFESALDAIESIESRGGLFHRGIALLSNLFMAGSRTYFLGMWSAYCVIRTMIFMLEPEANGWIYFPTSFIVCEGYLGVMGRKEKFRGVLSILHITMAMGLFVMFALNPYFLKSVYPWFFGVMKFDFPQ